MNIQVSKISIFREEDIKYILNYKRNPSVTFSGQLWKKKIRNENIFDIIFFNNQFCIKLLNTVTALIKPVHAVCHCIDKGSFLKMTRFKQLVFTQVLVQIRSLRPKTGMTLADEAMKCVQKTKQIVLV